MKDFLKENVRFIQRTEMVLGDGVARSLPERLRVFGWSKIGLVVDGGLYKSNEYVKEIMDILNKEMETVVTLHAEMPEPTYDYLDTQKSLFETHTLDCFVGIGGGSTLDLTKGLATMKTNKGDAIRYRGFGKVVNTPLPVVALPTTAGTGSDVTPYAVFIDTKERWKFGINTEHNYPRLALYDPGFLVGCPASVYASAGMDAMTHTLESFVAKGSTYLSKMFSRQAFKLLFPNLKKIARNDRSMETRINLLIGSGLAGIALMNAGAGPAGALSYPLGVYFDVPHGLAGSVFLPGVVKHNVDHGFTAYSELYDLVSDNPSLDGTDKSIRFADEIRMLSAELGIPTDLHGFGVKTEADRKLIIDNSMQLQAAFEQNPVPFGPNEIEKLINSLR
jgi:alcohol dehydrogenase